MPRDPSIQVEATVIEGLTATKFRVAMENGKSLAATLSGKMRLEFIRVLPGDKVLVELSPYDLSKGRIVSRRN